MRTWSTSPGTWPPCSRYDEIADIAEQAERVLPGTLAVVAYLAEIRPLIPPAERAWILVAELEFKALLRAGDLRAATRQLHAIHDQVQARAAADPANTEWQRDLSVSHDKLGDVAIAAGDLAAARAAYQAVPGHRRPAGRRRPGNTGWQRDLSVSHNKLGDVAVAAGDLAAARDRLPGRPGHRGPAGRRRPGQHRLAARPVRQPQQAGRRGGRGRGPGRRPRPPTRPPWTSPARLAAADPGQHRMAARPVRQPQQAGGRGGRGRGPGRRPRPPTRPPWTSAARLAAADPGNTEWQRDLSVSRNKLGDVAVAAGDLAAARDHYQAALDIADRLAAADPGNTEWQRDLSVSRNKLGDVAIAAGDLAAARDHLPGRPGHRRPAGRRRPRQHRMAARPVDQPQQAGGRGGRGRGPGRRPRHYQAGLDIAAQLAAADPANTRWQRDLEAVRQKMIDLDD